MFKSKPLLKYSSIHRYVVDHKGLPKKCEMCGTTKLYKNKSKYRQIWWVNKSHKPSSTKLYTKDLNDWISLCVKCHRIYDKPFSPGIKLNLVPFVR